MPKYDFKCPSCGSIEEYEHSVNDDPTLECEDCCVEVKKMFTATPAIFKGQGWSKITEYKPKGS